MYICLCKAISDLDLKMMSEEHPNEDIFEVLKGKLGLGEECGLCLKDALEHSGLIQKKGA